MGMRARPVTLAERLQADNAGVKKRDENDRYKGENLYVESFALSIAWRT